LIFHAPAELPAQFRWPPGLRVPLAIAHRGASGHATENTLTAFAIASDLGAQMWEIDTQLTRDGICVVSHDDHLFRVFGIDVRISELTAEELSRLAGGAVPTFRDVAALARSRGAGLYVELKAPGTGALAWRHLEENDQRFAAFGSFNVDIVRELRDAGCDYPLSVLVPLGTDPRSLADIADADIVHLCWEQGGARPQDLVTRDLIEEMKPVGRHLVLWHEERPDVIADLVRLPVIGICSNRPELLLSAVEHVASP
jgi:glycerophosphoryl diester phosphodiesterase